MSQEREELIRQAIRAVNEGDLEAIVAMTGREAEYEMIGGFADIVGQTVLRGPEGMRRFYTDWFATFTTTHVEPTAFHPAGDSIGQIYTFRDGCIHRVASYYDPQEALAAAQVAEQQRAV